MPLRIVALLLLTGLANPEATTPKGPSHIHVVSVSPAGPGTRGVAVTFTVVVDVEFDGGSAGLARLGFNDEVADRFRTVAEQSVGRGAHRITFHATSVPVDWAPEAGFELMMTLGPRQVGAV